MYLNIAVSGIIKAPKAYQIGLLLLIGTFTAFAGVAQTSEEAADIARRWRASMDAAEQQRIDAIKPNPFITGSHYVDSAYRIGFYFSPGDSIVNKSGSGAALITISNGFYYLRMNTVSTGMSIREYAEKQHDLSKSLTPEGFTNYKVSKPGKGENQYCLCYSYRITYTDRSGQKLVSLVRMQYGTNSSIVKLVALFPDDRDAASKETKLNDFANSVSAW